MAWMHGTAAPKPEKRKKLKGRADRAEAKVKKAVRAECVERDGDCRVCDWELNPCDTHDDDLEYPMMFFVGLHHPADSQHFERAFISVNVLRKRRSGIPAKAWIMDSGAFSTIAAFGGYPLPVSEYADQIRRFKASGTLMAAVAQDYMCEPWMLEKTGLTVAEHQRLTIERYDDLLACDPGVYIMPVLQGYAPSAEYVDHLNAYGERLAIRTAARISGRC